MFAFGLTCCELGCQVLDVGGGQSEGLDLAQLPIDRLRGDEVPQVLEGPVDALGPAALSLVGVTPDDAALHHEQVPRFRFLIRSRISSSHVSWPEF